MFFHRFCDPEPVFIILSLLTELSQDGLVTVFSLLREHRSESRMGILLSHC